MLVRQTAVHLPMDRFCGLNGVEQVVVPLVGVSEDLLGGVDMMEVLIKHRGNGWLR